MDVLQIKAYQEYPLKLGLLMEDFSSELIENTLPPEVELLMEVLGTLVLNLPRITPFRIGTSHGGLCRGL